jgi:uncharacterized protein YvpB
VAVIAVEREQPAASVQARPPRPRLLSLPPRRTPWPLRPLAGLIVLAVVSSLGGGGVLDSASSYVLQARAQALNDRWSYMRVNGIPDADLASLRQEYAMTQASIVVGAGGVFWLPGGADTIVRWQAETDAIWARDLSLFRAQALQAEQTLHLALAPETFAQRKPRLETFAGAVTPLDFATLRDDWSIEARLVPVDRRIASIASAVVDQTQQANHLGIRSDPAAATLGRADQYANLGPQERMARAEFLTRNLLALQGNLKDRIGAATVTQADIQKAADESAAADLYGIDVSAFQGRIANDRVLYANAVTVGEFQSVSVDAQQVTAASDHAINVVASQTHVISGVTFIYQNHPLSCEEAATSMALTHQGISLSQDQILAEIGADRRPMYVDSAGRVRWGNPYETFVGNVNGSESNYTGFGTYYPPLVRVARAHGARILAYGSMSAGTIYARVIAGHPVVAFSTWDWQWHPRRDYLSFGGQWIPWIGPVYASHVYTVVGVSPSQVLVNDPIRGQYWISKAAFEAGYSDFQEAIVFA